MIISLNTALDLKIFSPSEPIGILIICLGLIFTGMIFTIEPMINEGKYETNVLKDGWTAVTKDKMLSAQFEHTVGIKDDGYEIFTLSQKGFNFPPYIK